MEKCTPFDAFMVCLLRCIKQHGWFWRKNSLKSCIFSPFFDFLEGEIVINVTKRRRLKVKTMEYNFVTDDNCNQIKQNQLKCGTFHSPYGEWIDKKHNQHLVHIKKPAIIFAIHLRNHIWQWTIWVLTPALIIVLSTTNNVLGQPMVVASMGYTVSLVLIVFSLQFSLFFTSFSNFDTHFQFVMLMLYGSVTFLLTWVIVLIFTK